MADISGKHIVITGGSIGIGYGVIQKCLEAGAAKIAVLDIRDTNDAIANLQKEYSDQEVIYLQTDVSDKANVQRSFEQAKTKFGHLDIVIGNAGVADEVNTERTIQVNLIGVMNSTYVAIDFLSKTQGGRGGIILNVASLAGLNFYCGFPAYVASKHGVVGFTQCFAHKYYSKSYGIKFMTICPGLTNTEILSHTTMFDCDVKAFEKFAAAKRYQTVNQVAESILKVLQKGNHGSIWTAEGGDLEKVSIHQYWKDAQNVSQTPIVEH